MPVPVTVTITSGSGSGDYQQYSYVGISAYAPNPGYYFAGWINSYGGNLGSPGSSSTNLYVTASPGGAAGAQASYGINYYSLSYGAGTGGSVSGDTNQSVAYLQDGTQVVANPDPGYYFVKWSDNNYSASRTDTNVNANISVTAQFAVSATFYELTVNSGTGSGSYEENDVEEVVAETAAEGYAFLEWIGTGAAYLDDYELATTDITMPASAVAITATYSIESVIKKISGEPILDVKEINDIILMSNKKIGGLSNNP